MSCVWGQPAQNLARGVIAQGMLASLSPPPSFGMFTDVFIAGLPSGAEESHFVEPAIKEFLTLPKAC